MLTSEISGHDIRLPSPSKSFQPLTNPEVRDQIPRDKYYNKIYASVEKHLILSCIAGEVDSLLCNVFFDTVVPCTLDGAQWLRIRQALGPFDEDPQRLARPIAARNPKLSILWLAVIWNKNGKVSEVVDCA